MQSLKFTETPHNHHYSFGYHTENKWLDGENIVLVRSDNESISKKLFPDAKTELVKLNVKTGNFSVIADGVTEWLDYLVLGKDVYYVKEKTLFKINTETNEERKLISLDGLGFPHATHDGRYLSLFNSDITPSSFAIFDTEKETLRHIFDYSFPEPYHTANHGMICPTDKELYFFAHEGDTRQVSDRLWLWSGYTGTAKNIATQRLSESGRVLDCYGHEVWSPNGKGLYFVKYRESVDKNGICYVDISTNRTTLLYSGYDYWHVGVSRSGRFLTADTRGENGKSKIILLDTNTGAETEIDSVKSTFKHPCHPHPVISPNGNVLTYHVLSDSGMTAVRFAVLK